MAINWVRRACCGLTATRASPSALHTCILLVLLPSGCFYTALSILLGNVAGGSGLGWGKHRVMHDQSMAGNRGCNPKTDPEPLQGGCFSHLVKSSPRLLPRGFTTLLPHQKLETNFTPKFFIQARFALQGFHKFSRLQRPPPGQPLPPGF